MTSLMGSVADVEPDVPPDSKIWSDGKREKLSNGEVADAVAFMLGQPGGVNIDEMVMTPLGQTK